MPTRHFTRRCRAGVTANMRSTTPGVIYLMGRDGEYLGFMPPQTGPEKLTEVLRKYLSK